MASAAVSDKGALRMRPTLFGCTSARLSVFTGLPLLRRHRNRCFADPLFLPCQKKWAKRGAWRRSGLYRSATEVPRRRTLRPAHENLSAKLDYCAACVETMLPSGTVSTQGDCKTRCCGDNNASTYAPVVQIRYGTGEQNRPPEHGFGYVCRGRCLHWPARRVFPK